MAKMLESNFMDGVFISEYTIKGVSSNYDPARNQKISYKFEVEKEVNGVPFRSFLYLAGNLLKDGSFPPGINNFLKALNVERHPKMAVIIDLFSISSESPEVIAFLLNKKIKLLSYVNGTYDKDGQKKLSYRFWGGDTGFNSSVNPFSPGSDSGDVVKAFKKALQKEKESDKDYIKYKPELLEKPSTQDNADVEDAPIPNHFPGVPSDEDNY